MSSKMSSLEFENLLAVSRHSGETDQFVIVHKSALHVNINEFLMSREFEIRASQSVIVEDEYNKKFEALQKQLYGILDTAEADAGVLQLKVEAMRAKIIIARNTLVDAVTALKRDKKLSEPPVSTDINNILNT